MIYTEQDIEHMMSFCPKPLRHLCFADHPKYSIKENNMEENKENNDSFKGILHEYSKPNQKLELEMVNGPLQYGGKDNPYEAIKVIEAWDLGFNLGNTVKYISRAGRKDKDKHIQDLEKALFYLKREIENLKNG